MKTQSPCYLWGYPADGTEPTNGYTVRYNSTTKQWELFAPAVIPAGTDQQVLQYNGAVLTAQDLILATKAIDNTTIPTDGMVLTYDNASGKVKFKAIPAVNVVTQIEFLAAKAAAGLLIHASGARTTVGIVWSYVPAAGKTLTIVLVNMITSNVTGTTTLLRNNGTTIESIVTLGTASNITYQLVTVGDQLIGDGAKQYDLDNTVNPGGVFITSTVEMYLT